MLEVLGSDYIKFARLKGLHEQVVLWKHGLKNALLPVITFAVALLTSNTGEAGATGDYVGVQRRLDRRSTSHRRDFGGTPPGDEPSIAVLIIVPSQGRTPAWFATSRARPEEGTCSTPVVSTRQ